MVMTAPHPHLNLKPTETLAKGRIAIIDDDPIFLDLMRDLLEVGEGYEVVSPTSWIDSLEFVSQVQPDLIILDLMLGRGQTGWGVLEMLRNDRRTAGIPIIMCSAAAPTLRQCDMPKKGQGALEAVAKPFDLDHLISVVERLVASRFAL